MKLKRLSPGTFTMGSAKNAKGDIPHTVTLTKAFFIGVHEVTQQQYERVMRKNPANFKGPNNPVEKVSWDEAVEFCGLLSGLPEEQAAGRVYRLPTEAEWEFACRAGTTTEFCFGEDELQLGNYAWYGANSDSQTHPVGLKQPNAWGLYDMHGNVLEWCADFYGDYSDGAVTDPSGPSTGSIRLRRGGCWINEAKACRSALRYSNVPSSRFVNYGFRVAMSLPEMRK
jgi:formylglycine-generating enzyme required for sulfatase activity